MAYGSHCYFKAISDGQSKPMWQLNDPALLFTGISVPVSFEISSNSPFSLSRALFRSDGFIYNLTNQTTLVARREPAPFQNGFLNLRYAVENWTTSGIPSEFILKRYLPRYEASSSEDTSVWVAIHGRMHTYRERQVELVNPVPEVKFWTEIQDFRFMTFNPPMRDLMYVTTNGSWPALDSAWLKNKYRLLATSRALAAGNQKEARGATFPRIAIVITVACFPIFALFLFARRQRSANARGG